MNGLGLKVKETFTTIHNYIDTESMILRKGAVSAKKEEKLLIPINMRDGIGSKLVYAKDENVVVEVVNAKKVMYENEEYSLTSLTRKLMDLPKSLMLHIL